MVTAHSLLRYFPPSSKEHRRDVICALLNSAGVTPRVEAFKYGYNVYADVAGGGTQAVSAHYDTANTSSENCQDNTASICHMLALAHAGVPCHLAFTDNEEHCNYDISGSKFYADGIPAHIKFTYCLELTAIGDAVWVDADLLEGVVAHKRCCPLNDAVFMRRSSVLAACVGILPRGMVASPYPHEWSICHSAHDTHDRAVPADMQAFTEYMTRAVCS